MDSIKEQLELLVLFSIYCYPKLVFYITINPLVRRGLGVIENVSLGDRETENETDNFGRSLLGCTAINRMIKCDRQGGFNYKYI